MWIFLLFAMSPFWLLFFQHSAFSKMLKEHRVEVNYSWQKLANTMYRTCTYDQNKNVFTNKRYKQNNDKEAYYTIYFRKKYQEVLRYSKLSTFDTNSGIQNIQLDKKVLRSIHSTVCWQVQIYDITLCIFSISEVYQRVI